MELKRREENGVVIVSATGRVDGVNAHELKDYLSGVTQEEPANIVLNFRELKYISSAGLRVILSTLKILHSQKRQLVLSELTGPVKDVFKLSGFNAILKSFDSDDDAIAAC